MKKHTDKTIYTLHSFRTYSKLAHDEKSRLALESIFKINLTDRRWSLEIECFGNKPNAQITFFEEDNCFGWMERLTLVEFVEKLEKNGFYISL